MTKFLLHILCTLIVGNWAMSYSQHLNQKDPTYFTADYRNIHELLNSNVDDFEHMSFCRDSTLRSEGFPLDIKNSNYPALSNGPAPPFILDTIHYNQSGYYSYYPHSSWFNQLLRIDVTYKTQETVFGQLVNPRKYKKAQIKDLFKMLIQFNIVDTYDHLYAELVITKEKEDTEKIEITYHCMYHICTSKCFDPEYDFSLRFIKKSGELVAISK